MNEVDIDNSLDITTQEPEPQSEKFALKLERRNGAKVFSSQMQDLWRYRELALELFRVTLKLRYAGSTLGIIWTILNPLLHIATYWLVFSYVVRMGIPDYPLFLIPGYLAWTFTFSSLILASESIINGKYLITKIAFPIEILTLTSVAVSLFDFVVSLTLYLLAIVLLPPTVPVTVIALPLVMFVQILFTVGLAMLVACGSVYFRDVPKLVQIIGTLMFFLTPIFYPLDFIPEALRSVIRINLMAPIITFYHNILYDKTWPEAESLMLTGLAAMAFFIIGIWIFNRKKHAFAELT